MEADNSGITAADLDGGATDTPAPESQETNQGINASDLEFDIQPADDSTGAEDTVANEDIEDVVEDDTDLPAIAKQLKEKYPNIYKEIPALRKALFVGPQFLEIFNTPEEARETVARIESYDSIIDQTLKGNVEVLLDSIYDAEPAAISGFCENILPTVYKKSQEIFRSMVNPVFAGVIRTMIADAKRINNEAMEITAKNLSQYLFNAPDPPSFDNKVSNQPDPEKDRLAADNKAIMQTLATDFYDGVKGSIVKSLESEIGNRIDPKNTIAPGLRKLIIDNGIQKIRAKIASDQEHNARFNTLRQRALKDRFQGEHRGKLVNAYLSTARTILPNVVNELRAELINKQKNNGNGKQAANPNQPERKRNDAGKFVQNLTNENVDWNKIKNDKDFLFGEKVPVRS